MQQYIRYEKTITYQHIIINTFTNKILEYIPNC